MKFFYFGVFLGSFRSKNGDFPDFPEIGQKWDFRDPKNTQKAKKFKNRKKRFFWDTFAPTFGPISMEIGQTDKKLSHFPGKIEDQN